MSEDEEEEEEEEEDEEEEDEEEDEEEEDEEDETPDEEEEDEEEEEEDDEDDEEEDEEDAPVLRIGMGKLLMSLMGKKRSLKNEPEIVQKFAHLLEEPTEENPIDAQIQQFKGMTEEKQREIIHALENRPTVANTGIQLMLQILTLKVAPEVRAMIFTRYHSLQNMDPSTSEYYKLRSWLEKVVAVPFGMYKDLPVRLEDGPERCGEFMRAARACLDRATYGQDEPKLQIMQFMSTKMANPAGRGLSLLLVGPPGIGKTTIIKNGIAKALGWPFQFISLGGDSDASTYTGHQLVYESSHCGKIVNSLVASKSLSTVMMFDEVDKISQTAKGEEIMNLLIHLTDPVQNSEFEDKYLAGVPIDLSKVMFVFSANDISRIDRVLLDRMIVIDLKGYEVAEKTAIAEQYLVPDALREVNLTEKVSIPRDVLTAILHEYASEEKGVRELKRCIDQIAQKINMLRMFNAPELPFHIPSFSLPFVVRRDHLPLFLKRKGDVDAPPFGMYL
jgi:ATP-dependent Lon protease